MSEPLPSRSQDKIKLLVVGNIPKEEGKSKPDKDLLQTFVKKKSTKLEENKGKNSPTYNLMTIGIVERNDSHILFM